jgi:UrcA family protein
MSVRTSTLVLAALSAAALLGASPPTFAQGATVSEIIVRPVHRTVDADTPSAKVSYADLDIRRIADARTLVARIKAAAIQVCAAEKGDLPTNRTYRTCIRTAVSNAVRDVSDPAVYAAYAEGG